MANRLKQVERAVCDHITLMQNISKPENPDDYEYKHIFGLSTQKKIDILKLNHYLFDTYLGNIMQEIEDNPETTRKVKIFRLKGMNQSYNMLDSKLFREQNVTMQSLLRKKERVKKKQARVQWDSSDESDGKEIVKIRNKPRKTNMHSRVRLEATPLPVTKEDSNTQLNFTGSVERFNN